MNFSNEFWIQILIYVASIGSFAGTMFTRLKYIEAKQDKHNKFMERLTVAEQSLKSAHKRLDKLEKE